MKYSLNTAPIIEPLTLAEAKAHLNIPDVETYWDDYVTALIVSARESVEQITYRGLLTQTWTLYLDSTEFTELYERIVEISKVPVQSISSIKYYNQSNTLTTLDASKYITDLQSINQPARIQFIDVPNVYVRMNAVEIRFVCGWTSAELLPMPIKQAMKLIIGHLYEHREAVTVGGSPAELPMGAQYLLNPYSLNWFYRSV